MTAVRRVLCRPPSWFRVHEDDHANRDNWAALVVLAVAWPPMGGLITLAHLYA